MPQLSPDQIRSGLKWLQKWVVGAIKSSVENGLKFLWRTFWTGSLVGMLAISVLIVIVASYAMAGLGLAGDERASATTTLGAVLLLAWLARLIMYMVMGGSRSTR
jgi:hypothetical protein